MFEDMLIFGQKSKKIINVYYFQQRDKVLCVIGQEKHFNLQEKKERKSHKISKIQVRLFNVYFFIKIS